jgi:hypothetical protein
VYYWAGIDLSSGTDETAQRIIPAFRGSGCNLQRLFLPANACHFRAFDVGMALSIYGVLVRGTASPVGFERPSVNRGLIREGQAGEAPHDAGGRGGDKPASPRIRHIFIRARAAGRVFTGLGGIRSSAMYSSAARASGRSAKRPLNITSGNGECSTEKRHGPTSRDSVQPRPPVR